MRFSIVIPVVRTKYFAECLSSALGQTCADYEVLVVDDCSPEPVRSIVEEFAQPKLRYVRTPENLGRADPSATWNFALEKIKGDYVTLLGDDDRLSLNYLEEMDRLIQGHPEGCIFRSRLVLIGPQGDIQRIGLSLPELETWDEYIYVRHAYDREQSTAEICAKAEALRALGGYIRMPLALGSDDLTWISLCLRTPMVSTNRTLAYWRRHEHATSVSARVRPELSRWVQEVQARLFALIKSNKPKVIEEQLLISSVKNRLASYIGDDFDVRNATFSRKLKRGVSLLASLIIPSFFEVRLRRAWCRLSSR
jgi:glycosyltransferase involved in cell wall biosynthesis